MRTAPFPSSVTRRLRVPPSPKGRLIEETALFSYQTMFFELLQRKRGIDVSLPLGEGKGMRNPLFSLISNAKHSFGDEGKCPFPRACLPLRGRCRQLQRRRRMRVTQKVFSWFKLFAKPQFERPTQKGTPIPEVPFLIQCNINYWSRSPPTDPRRTARGAWAFRSCPWGCGARRRR